MNGLFVGDTRCLASATVLEEYSIRHVIDAAVDVSLPRGATDDDDANKKFRDAGVSYVTQLVDVFCLIQPSMYSCFYAMLLFICHHKR